MVVFNIFSDVQVYVDTDGNWKLGGFYHSVRANSVGAVVSSDLDYAADARLAEGGTDGGRTLPPMMYPHHSSPIIIIIIIIIIIH